MYAVLAAFHAPLGSTKAAHEDVVADIATHLVDLVHSHHIVGIWDNSQAQNDMLNAIDDYLWDDVEAGLGFSLTPEDEGAIRDHVIGIAKARYP